MTREMATDERVSDRLIGVLQEKENTSPSDRTHSVVGCVETVLYVLSSPNNVYGKALDFSFTT